MSDQLFPHTGFGYRLEFKDKADKKICWFCHPSHVTKYIERYKIDINECKIDIHSDYPAIEGLTTKKAPKKTTKTTTTKKPKKQELFADLDTYVKIKEPETKPKRSRKASPAAPRSARKTPQATPKGQPTQEAPRLLSDRFKASKK